MTVFESTENLFKQFVLPDLPAGARPAYLAVLLVRDADDGGVDDVVGAEQPRLQDVGRDFVHPEVDHVLDLLDEVDDALGVVVADVAGPEKALLVEVLLSEHFIICFCYLGRRSLSRYSAVKVATVNSRVRCLCPGSR